MFYRHEGYGSVTHLDAARVNRTNFHNPSVHRYYITLIKGRDYIKHDINPVLSRFGSVRFGSIRFGYSTLLRRRQFTPLTDDGLEIIYWFSVGVSHLGQMICMIYSYL